MMFVTLCSCRSSIKDLDYENRLAIDHKLSLIDIRDKNVHAIFNEIYMLIEKSSKNNRAYLSKNPLILIDLEQKYTVRKAHYFKIQKDNLQCQKMLDAAFFFYMGIMGSDEHHLKADAPKGILDGFLTLHSIGQYDSFYLKKI